MDSHIRCAARHKSPWEALQALLRAGAFTSREGWVAALVEKGLCVPGEDESYPPCPDTGCTHQGEATSVWGAKASCQAAKCYLWHGVTGHCMTEVIKGVAWTEVPALERHLACDGSISPATIGGSRVCRCPCHGMGPTLQGKP